MNIFIIFAAAPATNGGASAMRHRKGKNGIVHGAALKIHMENKMDHNHQNRPRKILTLCFVHQHPRILLGMKKQGFGAGRWNGFGGKVEPGESIEDAARREMKEEAGIEVREIKKMGVIDFEFRGKPEILEVHIFKSVEFSGEPTESDEMRPQWFSVDQIPFTEMWTDDIYWLPLFLKNIKFTARFLFDEKDQVLEHTIHKTIKVW